MPPPWHCRHVGRSNPAAKRRENTLFRALLQELQIWIDMSAVIWFGWSILKWLGGKCEEDLCRKPITADFSRCHQPPDARCSERDALFSATNTALVHDRSHSESEPGRLCPRSVPLPLYWLQALVLAAVPAVSR
eukprot:3225612-Rhodomonas_salina.1